MKMILFTIFLNLVYISNETGCSYYEKVGVIKNTDDDSKFLEEFHTEEEKRQKCYSLSNFDGDNSSCCYKNTVGCFLKENDTPEDECPKNSAIYNNCGMAGFYEPLMSTICTEISLVQGYCCFVKTNKGNACIRTKKLHKDVNATTDQINDFVKSIANDGEVQEVICKGWNLKIYNILIWLITLMLI